MDKVKLGIIGIGGMGTNHLNSIVKGMVPNMELTCVADVRQCRLDWAKENPAPTNRDRFFEVFGISEYPSLDDDWWDKEYVEPEKGQNK